MAEGRNVERSRLPLQLTRRSICKAIISSYAQADRPVPQSRLLSVVRERSRHELARWVCKTSFKDLPDDVIQAHQAPRDGCR